MPCPVCGSRRAGCPSLEAATPIDGYWCPELERAYAAAREGVKRCKNGNWPPAWYRKYCFRAGAGIWGDNPALRERMRTTLAPQVAQSALSILIPFRAAIRIRAADRRKRF
jgi:hypothetical protein